MYQVIRHAVLYFLSLSLMGLKSTFALADPITPCIQFYPALSLL